MGFDGFSLVSLLSSCSHVGALSVGAGLPSAQIGKLIGVVGECFCW